MVRIDMETAAQIHMILSLCRSRGQDPVAVLDRAGLLRHRDRKREDAVDMMDMMIQMARSYPADKIPGMPVRMNLTPLDIKATIIEYLETIRKGLIKGDSAA